MADNTQTKEGETKQVGVLIIHGIFGSSREFDGLAKRLNRTGYQTRQVTLPGHGPTPELPMNQLNVDIMKSHCLAEYHLLAETCDEVVIIGHSLGGICTLLTAAARPEKLAGVLTFSTPCDQAYFINHPKGFTELSADRWARGLMFLPQSFTVFEKPDFKPWWFPVLKRETEHIFKTLNQALPDIQVPVCLTHSLYDMAIPYAEMGKLEQRLVAVKSIEVNTIHHCGHQIFAYGLERENAMSIVLAFLKKECSPVAPKTETLAEILRITKFKTLRSVFNYAS
ncbi:MAG: alpha/beta hydrolase [Cyanobacteria bacterium]|nr:alpha/beta hydrolase [Cyanobacteriota bacterium]